jgi:hypothetical protein
LSFAGSDTVLCVLVDHWCINSTSSNRRASLSTLNREELVESLPEGDAVLVRIGQSRTRASRSQLAAVSRAMQLAHGTPCSSHYQSMSSKH